MVSAGPQDPLATTQTSRNATKAITMFYRLELTASLLAQAPWRDLVASLPVDRQWQWWMREPKLDPELAEPSAPCFVQLHLIDVAFIRQACVLYNWHSRIA